MQIFFRLLTTLAICTLVVLDTWALVTSREPQQNPVADTTMTDDANVNTAVGTANVAVQSEITAQSAESQESSTGTFTQGTYLHEQGEYAFSNAMLVPSITFQADGTFTFSENTGSGMGTCTGIYTLSKDGTEVTCTVTSADISCPDVISLTVRNNIAVLLNTDMKKSIAGDTFVLQGA